MDVLDDDGKHVGAGNGGLLVVTEPWPSMLRGIWGDPERFIETYWEKFDFEGTPQRRMYFAGDGARLDEDGDIWLMGRVDDVMNVSGHRLSTAEIESALVSHPIVAEAAVVGAADEDTGQAVVAFVILRASRGGTTGYYNQSDPNNNNGLNTFSQRYDDPYYIQNINRSTTAGLFAGSYHFSRPDIIETTLNSGGIANSGADEADHFIQMAGQMPAGQVKLVSKSFGPPALFGEQFQLGVQAPVMVHVPEHCPPAVRQFEARRGARCRLLQGCILIQPD